MVEPPTLFRAVDHEEAWKKHKDGILWFRAPGYFHTINGVARDPMEGIGTFRLPDGQLNCDISDHTTIRPVFILSFSAEKDAVNKFGAHCLKVRDPVSLQKRVEAALLQGDVTSVSWKKVEYGKTMEVKADPGPCKGWVRKYYSKPEEFSDEREWRLMIEFRHSFRILNKTLKLHTGRLTGHLFQLVSSD